MRAIYLFLIGIIALTFVLILYLKRSASRKLEYLDIKIPGLIVSLTTIPSRLAHIRPTLDSLHDQTILPEKIVLAIPHRSTRFNQAYTIPDFLTKENYPLLELLRCEDYGPATKVLATLKADKADKIIFTDDDRIYDPQLVEKLYKTSLQRPEDAVTWLCSGYITALLGCGGVLVNKKMFTDDVFEIPESIKFVDDIWLSGHILKNGYRIWGIGEDDQPRHKGNNVNDLYKETPRDSLNDECIQFYLKQYGIKIEISICS